jgi:hypothetical protein
VNGADQALAFAVLADRLASGLYPDGDRWFRNDPSIQDFLDQLILADHPYSAFSQHDQMR